MVVEAKKFFDTCMKENDEMLKESTGVVFLGSDRSDILRWLQNAANENVLLSEAQACSITEMLEKIFLSSNRWRFALQLATYINSCGIQMRKEDPDMCG